MANLKGFVLATALILAPTISEAGFGGRVNCWEWSPGHVSCRTKDIIIETDRNYGQVKPVDYVSPHVRRDGTFVPGHIRSRPDGNPYNNWGRP